MAGLQDTVSELDYVDLDHGLITSLYNPVAAVSSMHFGYALLIGAVLVGVAHSALLKVAAARRVRKPGRGDFAGKSWSLRAPVSAGF
jgi:hypothetical protein